MSGKDTTRESETSVQFGQSAQIRKKKSRVIGTPYDDAFRTLTIDCPGLLIPVINEVFGKTYTGREQIIRHPNEHFVNESDGTYEKRITDSDFSVIGIMEERYVFECQSTEDDTMIIRIVEYSLQSALDEGEIVDHRLTLSIPNAAVLFLRSNGNMPSLWNVDIQTPGGSVTYDIPIIKMADYMLEDIFAKKLFFLLPFYIFNREEWIKVGEDDQEKLDQLLAELKNLADTLEALMEKKAVTAYEYTVIMEMTKVVSNALIGSREKIKEGVNQIMGGRILNYPGKEVYQEGQADGIAIGEQQGITIGENKMADLMQKLFSQGRVEDAQKAASDQAFRNTLFKEFNIF